MLKQKNISLDTELRMFKIGTNDMLGKFHRAVSRMASSPIMFTRSVSVNEGQEVLNTLTRRENSRATLSTNPKSLHALWMDYQNGIGGKKPEKLFTHEERGKVKHKYCVRKPFWELIERMIQNGFTANLEIDKVYNVYDRCGSLTNSLREIRRDKGGNMELHF